MVCDLLCGDGVSGDDDVVLGCVECGCVAVHGWRGVKGGRKVTGAEGEGSELLGREEDRKDSEVVDDEE